MPPLSLLLLGLHATSSSIPTSFSVTSVATGIILQHSGSGLLDLLSCRESPLLHFISATHSRDLTLGLSPVLKSLYQVSVF